MDTQHNGNALIDYFENHEHRLIHKWMHYFEIYDRHFAQFRNQPLTMIEFGVMHGGSLQMWKWYFGAAAQIHGVDINPRCSELAEDRITIHIGDQENRESLRHLTELVPKCDIIIDDGGHLMRQQCNTFEEMWGHLKDGGVYLCEDTMTSYWPGYGGGYKRPDTFIEYTKSLVDQLHAWHTKEPGFTPDAFTQSAFAVHYYDSVVVIEKRAMQAPQARMKGTPSFDLIPAQQIVFNRG